MAGYRPAYTLKEDRKILRYIVDGDHGSFVKGDGLWKRMEEEKVVPDRTWQSLKNRWTKTIAKDLGRPELGLTQEEKTELRAEMGGSSSRRRANPFVKTKAKDRNEGKEPEERRETHLKEEPLEESKKKKDFYSLDLDGSDEDSD